MRLLALLAITLALAGCASPGAAWISASKFNYREYERRRVAVMPLMLHDLVDEEQFPSRRVQAAIVDQLGVLQLDRITEIEPADAQGIAFPYTPRKLVEFGAANGYDAVIGATMIRMEARPARKRWSFTGYVTFVDVKTPERRWTVARTWDFVGDPRNPATTFQLGNAFLGDFLDVRHALKRGSASVLLRRDTVVVDAGPIVNMDIVDSDPGASNEVKQTIAAATVADLQSPQRHVQVDVFALDDEGIRSLLVENASTGESAVVWGPRPGNEVGQKGAAEGAAQYDGPEQKGGRAAQKILPSLPPAAENLPLFIAHRVPVGIGPGHNEIRTVAVNGIEEQVVRTIRVETEVSEDAAVDMMVIAATSFDSLPANQLSQPAADRVRQLTDQQGVLLVNGARATTFADAGATRQEVIRGVTREWARPGSGSRRVLAFIGRAEMLIGRPYLMLYDAEPDYPEIGSVSLEEFAGLMKLGIARASFDLCTNDSRPDDIEKAVRSIAGSRIDVSVTRDCAQPIGDRFLELDEDELRDD